MKLYLKQKVFSWTDTFTIKNESGETVYTAAGEMFSFGHRLHVKNAADMEIAFIRQKIMAFMPRYYISIGGVETVQLVKKLTFLSQRYHLEGTSLMLEGDFTAHEYTLTDQGRVVMRVSKEWFTWGDSYVLDIREPSRILLCLCIMLAVDCAMCSND